MKLPRFLSLAVAITGLNILLIQALPKFVADQEMSAQEKTMMDQMAKYGTPTKGHEFLKKFVGDWDVAITAWSAPGAPPQVSKGAMKNQLIFDGRYVKCDFEGMMGGMAFKGLQVIGYDLFKKMYTTFWIDSMSTSFLTTSGTVDMTGNVLTETGTSPDPMTDGKTMQKYKDVTTFMPDGTYRFQMFMVMPDGKEMKSIELVCTRKMM